MKRSRPPKGARPRRVLPPSRLSPAYKATLRLLGPAYARLGLGIKAVELRNPGTLVEAWREFQEGRSRLLIAFRHAYGDEPQLLSFAFDSALPREAKRMEKPLPRVPRARFVHGYEVPLWSDAVTRWILPRSGAIPVYHAKVHRPSLEAIRGALKDGPFPIALAPEGQISYRSETLPRIEEGAVRLGLWCAEELVSAGRGERVAILPLSLHYRYDEKDRHRLARLLSAVERECGGPRFDRIDLDVPNWRNALADRIAALDERLIGMAEAYYGIRVQADCSRDERLHALLEEALVRAEAVLGLAPSGDRITRVYRIRQEGWDRIFPEQGKRGLPPLARRLLDRRAGEAWYAMRHMEFVDLCYYLDSAYLKTGGEPSFDRLVEAVYSLADMASRLTGGDVSKRPNLLRKTAVISASPPIDLSAARAANSGDTRAASRAALSALEDAYLGEIRAYLAEKRRS